MSADKKLNAEGQKKAAALAAIKFIQTGMKIGLGTGSTANYFIDALGAKVKDEKLDISCVATSRATEERAKALGLKVVSLHDQAFMDFCFDGADEFDDNFNLIKGGGGALLVEKMVATSCRFVVTIADESKHVKKLGKFPLPVEVIPMGLNATAWKMERAFDMCGMKPKMSVRMKAVGEPFRTDMGNAIIDCACGEIKEAERLEIMLNNIPGVVNNGLFIGISGIIFVGKADGTVQEIRKA